MSIQLPQIFHQQNSMISKILPSFRKLLFQTCYRSSNKTTFPSVNPQAADFNDFSLLDVNHNRLMKEISGSLKVKYLSPYKNDSATASGILFGPHARPIIPLPVEPLRKKRELSIHFLIETGAPITYLSKQALKALFGVQDLASIESTNVSIWGVKLAVNPSIAHWQGVNILGANYLRKGNLIFECNYDQDPQNEACTLRKKQAK